MEKFGIFELLDALAALSPHENRPRERERTDAAPPPPPAQTNETPASAAGEGAAIAAFLARHAARSRQIDEKK